MRGLFWYEENYVETQEKTKSQASDRGGEGVETTFQRSQHFRRPFLSEWAERSDAGDFADSVPIRGLSYSLSTCSTLC